MSSAVELLHYGFECLPRNDLAKLMMHSADTAKRYVRRLLKPRTDPNIPSIEMDP